MTETVHLTLDTATVLANIQEIKDAALALIDLDALAELLAPKVLAVLNERMRTQQRAVVNTNVVSFADYQKHGR